MNNEKIMRFLFYNLLARGFTGVSQVIDTTVVIFLLVGEQLTIKLYRWCYAHVFRCQKSGRLFSLYVYYDISWRLMIK